MRGTAANAVAEAPDEWSKLPRPIVVDSGACDSVMPADWAPNYAAKESPGQGVMSYIAANGEAVPNQGQKVLNICTSEGAYNQMKFQLAPVSMALCSVSGLCSGGNRVVFEKDWGYIENLKTKHRTWLEQKEGLYVLDADIAPTNEPGFARPA